VIATLAPPESRRDPTVLPPSVVRRPLQGEPPTIGIAVGYSRLNTSPVLERFVARIDGLVSAKSDTLQPRSI
jgi:LysR family hca operon transcriptional activator